MWFFNALPIGPFNGGQFSKSLIEHTVNPITKRVKNASLLIA